MAQERQVLTERYALYNDDCMEVMRGLPDKSVHFSIYSPPFAGLYHYSSSARDLSNSRSYEEFLTHYAFVVDDTPDGKRCPCTPATTGYDRAVEHLRSLPIAFGDAYVHIDRIAHAEFFQIIPQLLVFYRFD